MENIQDGDKHIRQSAFSGTVFIFGLARSGTAMLRALLNQSRELCIDPYEARFLVNWMNNWENFGDLSNPRNFSFLYQKMQEYGRFNRKLEQSGAEIDEFLWYSSCPDFSVQGVFEGLVKCQTGVADTESLILVNKTPGLVNYLPLLYEFFPTAKFLHLIRDGRDTVLSQHYFPMKRFNRNGDKRLADFWENQVKTRGKKGMVVDAQKWAEKIQKIRNESRSFSKQYMEVRYEDLLMSPENTLQGVCDFIGILFSTEMTALKKRMETHSDDKVKDRLVKDNFNKYLRGIEPSVLEEIEDVAGDMLVDLGYKVPENYTPRKLPRSRQLLYKLWSRTDILNAAVQELGINKGIRFFVAFTMWQYQRKRKRSALV